ncbi:class I SAM-dependent methyltransferase [Bradyrhizobium sp. C-145]|uniref:class I SAM-dependent methyltransferase n=1 Tax=Bradyrhizobium sp. C-145 TaxID=574727 RepID=UPI00201B7094|nr:class I SAM-dependent methyltransferase [Bradyrhizobium sp. C-145]UQR65382.1 class I SAM-dependent methyltransferase [Bradyrhizobium sp. C-145]
MSNTFYGEEFYNWQREASFSSAVNMLPIVFEIVKPKSVIDVGCGVGTWLAAAKSLGAQRVVGVEGAWIKDARMAITEPVVLADLEASIPLTDRFDLVICMEVAEHLSERRAPSLISDLCGLSDVVLFGAAVPGQGGNNHVNEQWQSYWADLFRSQGRLPYDLVRPKVWYSDKIDFWYKQNALLYMTEQKGAELNCSDALGSILDIVHPEMSLRQDGPRDLLKKIPRATARAFEKRLNKPG